MKLKLSLVAAIWISWLGILLALTNSNEVKEDHIEHSSGVVREVSCVTSRSVNGLNLVILHKEGLQTEEYLNLPGSYQCEDDMAAEFVGEPVHLSKYKVRIVGLTIGDTVILDIGDGIERANDRFNSISFSFFMAVIGSVLIIVKRKRR